jgi:hypothetical protein
MLGYYLIDHNMGMYGTLKLQLQSFLTSAIPGGKKLVPGQGAESDPKLAWAW